MIMIANSIFDIDIAQCDYIILVKELSTAPDWFQRPFSIPGRKMIVCV